MARTISVIYDQIVAAKNAQTELAAADSTSKVAVFALWAYVVAVCIWTLESLFDAHKACVDKAISEMKPHKLRWYRSIALAFQFGQALVQDEDYYDNTGLTAEAVLAMQVIKHAAITESAEGNLRLKVATEVNGELAPLSRATPDQYTPFVAYMNMVKDAGVKLLIDSLPADKLSLNVDIYYDPLVIDATGGRLDGSSIKPVEIAIKEYLKALPFNGEFIIAALTDKLQITPGVVVPQINYVNISYGAMPWTGVNARYVPYGGYLRIYDPVDLIVNYIANA
jgi:hypothetical protein